MHIINYKLLFDNARWLFIYSLVSRCSWLVILYSLAYSLNVESYAEFTVFLTFWLFTFKLFGLGIETWVNRKISSFTGNKGRAENIFAALRIRLLLVTSAYLLIFFISITYYYKFNDSFMVFLFLIVGLRQLFENLRDFAIGVCQGLEKMNLQALSLMPADILQLFIILTAIFIFDIKTPNTLLLVIMCFSTYKVFRLWKNLAPVINNTLLKDHKLNLSQIDYSTIIYQSLPFGLSAMLAIGIGKIDILMLKWLDTLETVANYSFVYLYIDVIIIAFGVIRQTTFPALSKLAANDNKKFDELLNKVIIITALSGILLAILVAKFSTFILPDYFELKFVLSSEYLPVLAISLPFYLLSTQLGSALISKNKINLAIAVQFISLFTNIIANYFLIQYFSGLGAIWATILSYFINCSVYMFILKRIR